MNKYEALLNSYGAVVLPTMGHNLNSYDLFPIFITTWKSSMKKLMELLLSFTHKTYSPGYKLLSLIPGTVVFLIISPLFLFFFSRYLSRFITIAWPRTLEIGIAVVALSAAVVLMTWGFVALWFDGRGTPAPITPTKKLVTTGPYKYCRNPIELGTELYFLFLGTWFDTLTTGLLCMFMGMLLGYSYIKIVEERELKLRFGKSYEDYLASTPLSLPRSFSQKGKSHG
jgi:protein-S-isoprenylcysteine O-methyltransferase Ste14